MSRVSYPCSFNVVSTRAAQCWSRQVKGQPLYSMVKQQRRTDRSFPPAAGNSVTWVRFPVSSTHRRHLTQQVEESTTEEERGGAGPDGGSGDTKRARLDGSDDAAALTNREKVSGSCGQPGSERCPTAAGLSSRPPPPDQQGSAEKNDNSRAAELQSVRSLQVTIQQTSESREFGQTDRSADRQTGGLLCHVCDVTCVSLQVFQDHMTGPEHLRKLREMTHSINTHTLQDRGCRPDVQRWCDTCRTHFSGDIIVHRRTKQHKMCKQLCRPFCPVCKRHFRTPRKFVEHMKSAEHKDQVHQEEVQEEELITVDAIGCFKEGEEEEEDEGDEEVEVAEEEDGEGVREEEEPNIEVTGSQETDGEEYDPQTIYGSSYVLPVSGFLCRLCNKFFYREMTARHTHCRTHTHYVNLKPDKHTAIVFQSHRAQRRPEDQDAS